MGEEGAGISAIETAFARIKAGQSTHTLVGGAFSAERLDMILLIEAVQGHALGDYHPIWSRKPENGGGMITGSVGAFLMLESREHAEARGARIYATIDAVGGDRGSREGNRLEQRLQYLTAPAADADPSRTVVFSGTTGFPDLAAREKAFLDAQFPKAAVRAYGGLVGHALESQFPLGLAFAALSLGAGAKVPPFDPAAEAPMEQAAKTAIVTTIGHARGEGIAVLSAEE
jgi:3-oxoacyl-[acyl-carrier-protein] synthase II